MAYSLPGNCAGGCGSPCCSFTFDSTQAPYTAGATVSPNIVADGAYTISAFSVSYDPGVAADNTLVLTNTLDHTVSVPTHLSVITGTEVTIQGVTYTAGEHDLTIVLTSGASMTPTYTSSGYPASFFVYLYCYNYA